MITIEKLCISYGTNNNVIDELSLSIKKGLIHGIVGLNGAGKTSLFNAVFGLIKIKSGSIQIDNQKTNKHSIAFLPTENFFYTNITGIEYLNLFKNQNFDIGQWNKLFTLPLESIIDGYSSGMKKKLALLGVLKQEKPIMILDEPFNGVDIETARIIRLILLRLKENGKTILISSHIIETLTNLCDFIHYLEKGVIKQSIDKKDFFDFENRIFKEIESKNIKLIKELTNHMK